MNIGNVDLKMFIEFPGILITIGVILLLISIMIVLYVYISENRVKRIDSLELSNPVSYSQGDVMSEINELPQVSDDISSDVSSNDAIYDANLNDENMNFDINNSLENIENVSLQSVEADNSFSTPKVINVAEEVTENNNELFEDMFTNEFKELSDIQEKEEPKIKNITVDANSFDKQESEEEEIELL